MLLNTSMNPIHALLISVVSYAVGNHIMETKLSSYAAAVTTTITSAVILLISATVWYYQYQHAVSAESKASLNITPGALLVGLLLVGVIFWGGDFFCFVAYSNKAKAFTVATMMMLIPVLVSVIDHITKGGWPNPGLFTGYVLSAVGGILVAVHGGE